MKILKNNLISKILIIVLTLSLPLFLFGCGEKQPAQNTTNSQKTVAVSIVPQETFVKAVAGDKVNTVVMIPPGASPESFAPSPVELQKLSQAEIYYSIGVPAETAGIIPKLKAINPNIKIINLAAEVNKIYPDLEFAPGERDPHIWLSPKRAEIMVDTIANSLATIDPKNKSQYATNATNYIKELDNLEEKINLSLGNLTKRAFIVYHPAFAYFADDFGLEMLAIEEEGKEASAEDISRIIDIAKKNNIKVIFYQAEISNRQAETIAREIGGKTEMIEPLAADYIENLAKTAEIFASVLK